MSPSDSNLSFSLFISLSLSVSSLTHSHMHIHTLIFMFSCLSIWASLVTQMVKNLPAIWQSWVQSLGGEDPVENEMAIHSSTLALGILWTEEPGSPVLEESLCKHISKLEEDPVQQILPSPHFINSNPLLWFPSFFFFFFPRNTCQNSNNISQNL